MTTRNRIARIAAVAAVLAATATQAYAGLLLPAVQKVREAAAADSRPVENISLNVEKIEIMLAVQAGQLPPEALLEIYGGDVELMGNLDRDIIRRIPSRPKDTSED